MRTPGLIRMSYAAATANDWLTWGVINAELLVDDERVQEIEVSGSGWQGEVWEDDDLHHMITSMQL